MDDQNKNLILAAALSFLVIMVWFVLFPPEEPPVAPAETETAQSAAPTAQTPTTAIVPTSPAEARATALTGAERIKIETPKLVGTISLTGGRIDDLALRDYKETLDEDAETVTLLSPVGTANAGRLSARNSRSSAADGGSSARTGSM